MECSSRGWKTKKTEWRKRKLAWYIKGTMHKIVNFRKLANRKDLHKVHIPALIFCVKMLRYYLPVAQWLNVTDGVLGHVYKIKIVNICEAYEIRKGEFHEVYVYLLCRAA